MSRLTDWVLAHRWVVVVAWLAVAVAGGATAPITVDRLGYDFALPGQPAYEANEEVGERYGADGHEDPLALVVRGPAAEQAAAGLAEQAAAAGVRAVTAADPGGEALTSGDGERSVVLLYPQAVPGPEPYAAALPRLERLAAQAATTGGGDLEAELTGFGLLTEGGSGGGGDRGVLVEVVLGGAGALVVLVLVFASLLAGVPLLVAAVSILGTFLALLGLTYVTDVIFVVQFLVALIGLGVAIDYSLLVVTRWREERDAGADDETAVRTAMATAGRSVVLSGVTVAVSLAALVLVPLPFLRSIGLTGLLIPLLSVATTTTLVPVLLASWGARLSWPRRRPVSARSRLWTGVVRGVLRRRWLTILATTAALAALAAPVAGLNLGSPRLDGLAAGTPGAEAVAAAVEGGVPAGVLRPVMVLAESDRAAAVAASLRDVDGVASVVDAGRKWEADGERLLHVLLAEDPASEDGRATVDRLRAIDAAGVTGIGGSPPEDVDLVAAIYGDVVWVVLAVVLLTFLLLARALRSLWLPVKALVLNVVSIAAAYGVTVLVWQHGHGSELLFDQEATGAVTPWVPIAAFAFLFGLSMDYEVFILARMRESYDGHGDPDGTDRAVEDGIASTGRLVTSAATILFLAFVALSTIPSVEVKIMATTLALGIVIDAVIVRGLLAPALVAVLGRANWTLPRPLGVLLRLPA